jgi:hypothetical protein
MRRQMTLGFVDGSEDACEVAIRLRVGTLDKLVRFSSSVPLRRSGEALLCLGLMPAMELGVPLKLDVPVDDGLASRIAAIQALLAGGGLVPAAIPVDVTPRHAPPQGRRGIGCFFSGGVDSFHTLLSSEPRPDTIITIIGADTVPGSPAGDKLSRMAQEVAAALDAKPIIVTTDLRSVFDRIIGWEEFHGSVLAAIAHMLDGHVQTARIAASADETAWNFAWGSGPVLDPMWSSANLDVEHHGCIARVEKIRTLAQHPVAMRHLRVCYKTDDGGNCGVCAKCSFARTTLELLGHTSPAFRSPPPSRMPVRITDVAAASKYAGLASLAHSAGRQDIAVQIDKYLCTFSRRMRLAARIPAVLKKTYLKRLKRRARAGVL